MDNKETKTQHKKTRKKPQFSNKEHLFKFPTYKNSE